MKHIRVPSKIKTKNHTYTYIEQINDNVYLYQEENLGYKECFLISDLVKLPDIKATGERRWI